MPSNLPIVENIAIELADRIATVTLANGYNSIVTDVERPARYGGWSPANGKVVLLQLDPELNDEYSSQGYPRAVAIDQPFALLCYVKTPDDDTTPIDTLINIFAADVIKAVTQPLASWHGFDGNAINARWEAPQRFEPDGTYDGVTLVLIVTYRTSENNPYEVR